MLRIILCGCSGKMGAAVSELAEKDEDLKIVAGVDPFVKSGLDYPISPVFQNLPEADVIIDFSNPASLNGLLRFSVENKLPVVIATTGYNEAEIEKIKKAADVVPVFFTFNMSLGINLLLSLTKKATEILGENFDIEIIEKHHNQKIDAPSGTAIMLANAVNETLDKRMIYEYDRHSKRQKRQKNEIGIHSVRGGTIVGEHEVMFAGEDEVVSLSHKAFSKRVFAAGAVKAAKFLSGKNPGLYSMDDLIGEN